MWKSILAEFTSIPNLSSLNSCSISFELYGSQNAHLNLYETALTCALLFGVTGEGKVRSPRELKTLDVPTAELHAELLASNGPVAEYDRFRAESEKRNQGSERIREGGYQALRRQGSCDEGTLPQIYQKRDEEGIHNNSKLRMNRFW